MNVSLDHRMNVLTVPSLDTLRWLLNDRISSVAFRLSCVSGVDHLISVSRPHRARQGSLSGESTSPGCQLVVFTSRHRVVNLLGVSACLRAVSRLDLQSICGPST